VVKVKTMDGKSEKEWMKEERNWNRSWYCTTFSISDILKSKKGGPSSMEKCHFSWP
jgi:hypothetical protein